MHGNQGPPRRSAQSETLLMSMLARLRDPQKRDKYLSSVRKQFIQLVGKPRDCKPVFVFGKQRSGTSMLMFAFHRHPDVLVHDEHRNSRVFSDFRIRGFDVVRDVVSASRFAVACFKPICDSHLIGQFVEEFPDAHHIWIFRQFQDVANSTLRKFDTPTRAIRLVCTGQAGGGWFEEGLSSEVRRVLVEHYRPDLSGFDLSCMVWWARNRIIVDSGLLSSPQVTLLKYEALVANPGATLVWLFERMAVPFHEHIGARMTPGSIGRHPIPPMDKAVRELCECLTRQLDEAYLSYSPPPPGSAERSSFVVST